MQRIILFILFSIVIVSVHAQDISAILKEADSFEKQLKETEALDKYKQVLLIDPNHLKSLVKVAELNVIMGGKEKDKNNKRLYFESALNVANKAVQANSTSADAYYTLSMVSGRLTDVEVDNKKIVGFVKDIKVFADKAISINPNHAKANYILGKWNLEMVTLSGFKKMAVKLLYGGLPDGDLVKAIAFMEKCKAIDTYFTPNYLDLSKAYIENNQPQIAIDILNKLIKLPTRNSEDVVIKAEGAKLLSSLN